jgi:hypothetical protein
VKEQGLERGVYERRREEVEHMVISPFLILLPFIPLLSLPMRSSVIAHPSGGRHPNTSAEKEAFGTLNSCSNTYKDRGREGEIV